MIPKSVDARLAVAENDIEGLQEDGKTMQETLQSILKAVQEIEKKMMGNARFWAGMCFAYSSIGFVFGGLLMWALSFFTHKPS